MEKGRVRALSQRFEKPLVQDPPKGQPTNVAPLTGPGERTTDHLQPSGGGNVRRSLRLGDNAWQLAKQENEAAEREEAKRKEQEERMALGKNARRSMEANKIAEEMAKEQERQDREAAMKDGLTGLSGKRAQQRYKELAEQTPSDVNTTRVAPNMQLQQASQRRAVQREEEVSRQKISEEQNHHSHQLQTWATITTNVLLAEHKERRLIQQHCHDSLQRSGQWWYDTVHSLKREQLLREESSTRTTTEISLLAALGETREALHLHLQKQSATRTHVQDQEKRGRMQLLDEEHRERGTVYVHTTGSKCQDEEQTQRQGIIREYYTSVMHLTTYQVWLQSLTQELTMLIKQAFLAGDRLRDNEAKDWRSLMDALYSTAMVGSLEALEREARHRIVSVAFDQLHSVKSALDASLQLLSGAMRQLFQQETFGRSQVEAAQSSSRLSIDHEYQLLLSVSADMRDVLGGQRVSHSDVAMQSVQETVPASPFCSVSVSNPLIPYDEDAEILVVADITAPRFSSPTKRPRVRLCAVLDVSGSMASGRGTMTRLRCLKDAMYRVLDNMEEGDQLGVVTYNENAKLLTEMTAMTDDGRRSVMSAVGQLYSDGGTNITAGLQMAAQLLTNNKSKYSEQDCVECILLLTDGWDNFGVSMTSLEAILNETNAMICTFGIGDHDTVLLQSIAKLGNGEYMFVDDIERMQEWFVRCVWYRKNTYADRMFCTIETSMVDGNGYIVTPLTSNAATCVGTRAKQKWVIELNNLAQGQSRKMTALLKVPKLAAPTGFTPVLLWELRYYSYETNSTQVIQHSTMVCRPKGVPDSMRGSEWKGKLGGGEHIIVTMKPLPCHIEEELLRLVVTDTLQSAAGCLSNRNYSEADEWMCNALKLLERCTSAPLSKPLTAAIQRCRSKLSSPDGPAALSSLLTSTQNQQDVGMGLFIVSPTET